MPARTAAPPLTVAPMMDRTDRAFRCMMRAITHRTLLVTEMVTTGALLRGPRGRLLAFDPVERPLSLQLGGDDPAALTECARMAADLGYDEVDLNVGCPSSRVSQGNFGVILMGDPDRVARCVEAMRAAVPLPVTVKHRIGFDDRDRYEDLRAFVDRVAEAGADRFAVHARKAWLQGLSPKENREIPPLRPEEVWRLKAERPQLPIVINGGVRDLDAAAAQLAHVDGVMIGRGAWDDPLIFADADSRFYGQDDPQGGPAAVVRAMLGWIEARAAEGAPNALREAVRPLLNLLAGRPGARVWRRTLTEGLQVPGAGPRLLIDAAARAGLAV